jgi:CRISPR-associated endoribonuclease Cas6
MEDADSPDHDDQDKVFTISPPWVSRETSSVEFSLQILSDDLAIVEGVRRRLVALPSDEVNLGRHAPLIDSVLEVSGVNWQQLADAIPRSVVRIETLSPVFFRRHGMTIPLPDPYLTITQLARRWNQHVGDARLRISDEWVKKVAHGASINSLNIRTQSEFAKQWKTGYVGEVSFATRSDDVGVQGLFSTLFEFAEYSGIGSLTTFGFGAVQIVDD